MFEGNVCKCNLCPALLPPLSLPPYWAKTSGPLIANTCDHPPEKQTRGAFSRMELFCLITRQTDRQYDRLIECYYSYIKFSLYNHKSFKFNKKSIKLPLTAETDYSC